MQPTPHDDQLMSKHRILSLKPQLRPEWRGQDGQSETEQPDHSTSLGDSITSSTQIRFSVHTTRTLDVNGKPARVFGLIGPNGIPGITLSPREGVFVDLVNPAPPPRILPCT